MSLDRIREAVLMLSEDTESANNIKRITGFSTSSLLSDVASVAIDHKLDLLRFSERASNQLSEVIDNSKSLSNEMVAMAAQFLQAAINRKDKFEVHQTNPSYFDDINL